MPELPEVESARSVIERAALRRKIVDVDDTDRYECRPHAPGDIKKALVGRQLTAAHRRGKLMWCSTSGAGSRAPGPVLGLHLGMAGRILVSRDGKTESGGDYEGQRVRRTANTHRKPEWDRFTIFFADGGTLRLYDKRRLGRVYLDPDVDALGEDAGEIGLAHFRDAVGRGTAPIKARLLDQSVIAGIGNLLADDVLWQARIDPRRPAKDLTADELRDLRTELRKAIRVAIRKGGVHTLPMMEFRGRDGHCPRDGAQLHRGTVGSRTTYWCPVEQV